jgi:AcrR family transcriptional regulator
MSPANVYRFFSSKNAIVEAITSHFGDRRSLWDSSNTPFSPFDPITAKGLRKDKPDIYPVSPQAALARTRAPSARR